MTALPEAKLAREAELCYAMLALVTDYDCWHPDHAAVTVEAIMDVMQRNVMSAQSVIATVVPLLAGDHSCTCGRALDHAIATAPSLIPRDTHARLGLLVNKYLGDPAG